MKSIGVNDKGAKTRAFNTESVQHRNDSPIEWRRIPNNLTCVGVG